MIDLTDIKALNDELAGAVTSLANYHRNMELFSEYYENSAFYATKAGERPLDTQLHDNYLQIFADKNIHYTSSMPEFKIAGTPEDRANANIREKILYAVHRKSGTPLLQKEWAADATKKSIAISEVEFDLNERCARVNRYDPREVFWKRGNGKDRSVTAFWAVFSITKKEAWDKYRVVPEKDLISQTTLAKNDPYLTSLDGQEWFHMAIRWDNTYRTAWVGDKLIEEVHEHGLGIIPVDVCAPFTTDSKIQLGSFYLKKLIPMQAELNDTVRRRSSLVKRMSNPIIWGRNISLNSKDDVEQALKNAETGVLGLGKDGEVGILQLQELKLLYEHETALKNDMQRLSGFAAASFGESVGANTSGAALGLYYTPTQKHVDDQQISWQSFYESINAKILRAYDVFGRTGEEFNLDGYHPRSTLVSYSTSETGYKMAGSGDFGIKFTREAIGGNYSSRAIMPPVIPKNELAEKEFWVKAAQNKQISKTTMYEKIGIESPEDEKALLLQEQSDPLLNPDVISTILQNQQMPQLPPGAPQTPQELPAPPNLAAGVPINGR